LQRRFNQPVKYQIHSHDHADHIAGGEVFADTAIVVAHANARAAIIGERRPTAVPQMTFSDQMTIELRGTTLELAYVGRNPSDNSIVMRFPKERVLFAVDFIPMESVAFRIDGPIHIYCIDEFVQLLIALPDGFDAGLALPLPG
jgi:glyoxylase-like metal-dependent hydrolase (beta-lactamase superfamily II)